MTVPIDFGKLYTLIEDPQTVVLRKRTGENSYEEKTVPYVYKNQSTNADVDIPGFRLQGTTTIFQFWTEVLDSVETGLRPNNLDEIVDEEGTVYSVLEIDVRARGNRYRVTCRQRV